MSDPLATYLEDHLAGASFALDLIQALRDQHAEEPLGRFAATLYVEIEEDRNILEGIINRLGAERPVLKEAAAWLGEKVSRLKLRRGATGGLGAFEALETLGLGILGKLALWRALRVAAEVDSRARGVDYDGLAARAQEQHTRVEEFRLETARKVFSASTE